MSAAAVEGYNLDDCKSALQLRKWLEELRASLEAAGTEVPRPERADGTASEPITERARRVQALFDALMAGIPAERSEGTTSSKRSGCSRIFSIFIGVRQRLRGGNFSDYVI